MLVIVQETKAGDNEKLSALLGLMLTHPQIQYSPKVRAKCLSSVETHFYLIVFLTAFPSMIRDCDANWLSSQLILMRERSQKDYGWNFKCLLKYTQKSAHCKRENALKVSLNKSSITETWQAWGCCPAFPGRVGFLWIPI